jgi:hypothetical protein
MPIYYENRAGELHYVKAAKTKKGGTRYYIVKDKNKYRPEDLLEEIPEGFEFYESPSDGLVSFRKIIKSTIADEELSILDSVMKKHETVSKYIIDKEANALMLYISDIYNRLWGILENEEFDKFARYQEKLRFEKNENNEFQAQRYCYLGRYNDWITMETSADLKYLAEKYCFHADKESLLEFWIEGEKELEAVLVGEIDGRPLYGFL